MMDATEKDLAQDRRIADLEKEMAALKERSAVHAMQADMFKERLDMLSPLECLIEKIEKIHEWVSRLP